MNTGLAKRSVEQTAVEAVEVLTYVVPTERPEADGTLSWDSTAAVCARLTCGEAVGIGWSYTTPAAAQVISGLLAKLVVGADAMNVGNVWRSMVRQCRNFGTSGLAMQAISALDIAMWDLKAKLLGVNLADLFGRVTDTVSAYGSGGFTTQTEDDLREQLSGWVDEGCSAVKIKIGESWGTAVPRDLARVEFARTLLPDDVELMVDANGGYSRGQAKRVGHLLDALGVLWFEEPVSSDDLEGLSTLRGVLRCDIAAGEYLSSPFDVERTCAAVDCLQIDATRCGGYTGFRAIASIAYGHNLQVSTHCAPSLHVPVACSVPNLRHLEWFADHVRLEHMLFAGAADVTGGRCAPGNEVGHGMTLNDEAQEFLVGQPVRCARSRMTEGTYAYAR